MCRPYFDSYHSALRYNQTTLTLRIPGCVKLKPKDKKSTEFSFEALWCSLVLSVGRSVCFSSLFQAGCHLELLQLLD